MASHMLVCGLHVSVGDIVLFGDLAGQVTACLKEDDPSDVALYIVVEELLAQDVGRTAHSGRYSPAGSLALWPANAIEQCMAWYSDEGGVTTVVRQ